MLVMMMRIVGIDPGLLVVGYGIIEKTEQTFDFQAGGIIQPPKDDSLENKIRLIYEGVVQILEEHRPGAIAVEDLYSHYNHPRTAILMGHARGVIYLSAVQRGVPIFGYSATQVKKALIGNGHASKGQMQRMVQISLGLREPPSTSHVADALALALCHGSHIERLRSNP